MTRGQNPTTTLVLAGDLAGLLAAAGDITKVSVQRRFAKSLAGNAREHETETVAVVEALSREGEASRRGSAAYAAGLVGAGAWHAMEAVLRHLADDEDWAVREAAASGLKDALAANFERVYPSLLVWAGSARTNIRRAGLVASGVPGPLRDDQVGRLLDVVAQLLPDREEYVRKNVAMVTRFLSWRHPSVVLPRLAAWAESSDGGVRRHVADAIEGPPAAYQPEESLAILRALAARAEGKTASTVEKALLKICRKHPALARAALAEWLDEPEPGLSRVAAAVLPACQGQDQGTEEERADV